MKPRFTLIGIDDNPSPDFTDEIRACIRNGRVFSGGERHYEIVKPLLPEKSEWIPVTVPLAPVFERYVDYFRTCRDDASDPIVVFVSGDPLFFGFANTVMREMPDASLKVYPVFNSLQTLAHRLLMRYDDMRVVSLTGRPWKELDRALIERVPKLGILTDRKRNPASIAARLLAYGYTYYIMYIGEHLGNDRECVRRMSLEEAAQTTFEFPNCIILHIPPEAEIPARPFGIPDENFELLDGRRRMITKMPIRILTLQALDLPRRHVLWDIGFCTGSVSIEAKMQFPHLDVFSFEVREECEQLMEHNCRRLGVPGIQSFIGDFLTMEVDGLPAPDAVFIGGHGGKLKEMLRKIKARLVPGGCVVFNSVSPESRQMFEEGAEECGLVLYPPMRIALDEYNPITIMKAGFADSQPVGCFSQNK